MEIAIFTRNKNDKLVALINDLREQTIIPTIKIYSDVFFSIDNVQVIQTKNMNISKKRNLAINSCTTDFLFLLDDDNRIFDRNFLYKLINFYNIIPDKCKIISPIIYYKDTDKIQSAGIKFSFFWGKVFVNKKCNGLYWSVPGMGGNSLFGKVKDFKLVKFDENIGYIREDIDYTYSLKEKKSNVYVVKLPINHMEREKKLTEKSFIENKFFKQKIKNRDIFVNKHGNFFQKVIYWLWGRWISYFVWLIKRLIDK